jgi:nascent polypeptide-associated complex subunit alpha
MVKKMMGSKRPMSPRQIKQMKGKMKTFELEGVEEVIIRFADKEISIPSPEVSKIVMAGSEVYQVMGSGMERPRGSDESATSLGVAYTDTDVQLVMSQTGASEEVVRKALEDENGDLAGAIVRLKTKK